MTKLFQCILLVAVLCTFSACRKEMAALTFGCLTVDRFGRTAEPGSIREAVTFQEVSFMVRMHEADAEILGQVQRRGLAEPVDDKVAATLGGQGASAPLLAQLKASPYLLTAAERELYVTRAEKRRAAGEATRSEQDALIASRRVELNQRIRVADRQLIGNRLQADQARVQELESKLCKERISGSSVSPYQGVARELDQARARVKATSAELAR